MISSVRRIGIAGAVISTVIAATTLISAGPATATASNRCWVHKGIGLNLGVLIAWNVFECVNPESVRNLDVKVEKLETLVGHPDRWVIVAKGLGEVRYKCKYELTTTYRLNGGPGQLFACGGQ